MKILRYTKDGITSYGVLKDDAVYPITGDMYGKFAVAEKGIPFSNVKVEVPCEPTKIVAVGLNYSEHAKEFGGDQLADPILFLKPTTSLLADGGTIIRPKNSERVDYEAELCVVIGKTAKDVTKEEANDYILGYTCANDVTARDLQKKDGQWTRGKGFDTFCPVGPWIETDICPDSLDISLKLNEEIKQDGNTNMMMFNAAELVSYISGIMTLLPGDIIITGTPAGIGPMAEGDRVSVTINGIGTLTNYVK